MGQYSTRHGFTLIELLIAILLVGILATLGVWGYQEYSVRARGADIITKYDALRTGVQARASKGKTDDCAQLARDFDTQNLADQYAALAYGFEAVVGGYRPVLIVCAKATKHGVLGVKVARAAHDSLAKTGTSEQGAVLTDTLVSFALPLTSDNQPLCKMAPAQKGECAPWSVSPPGPGGSKPVPARPPPRVQCRDRQHLRLQRFQTCPTRGIRTRLPTRRPRRSVVPWSRQKQTILVVSPRHAHRDSNWTRAASASPHQPALSFSN